MGDIPVLVVFDLDGIDSKFVLVFEIIALVDFVVVLAFWSADGILGHCFENNMDQLDVIRRHEETGLIAVQDGLFLVFFREFFAPELIHYAFEL